MTGNGARGSASNSTLLALALLVTLAPVPEAGGSDAEDAARRLEEVRERIEALHSSLEEDRTRRDRLQERLRAAEEEIATRARRLDELRSRLDERTERLERLTAERDRLETTLDAQRARLTSQLRSAYVMGRQQRLRVALSQEDPARVSRMLTYYDFLSRARARRIEAVTGRLERLREVRAEVAEERERLERLRRERAQDKRELERTRDERAEVLAGLRGRIRDKGERLAELEEDAARLEDLVDRLQRALDDVPGDLKETRPFAERKGALGWPTKGEIVARFGAGRDIGDLRWQGVLIDAPRGRPVRTVARGRVAFADWLRGFGLMVIVDHGDGYMTLYGHNESLYADTGEWVDAGAAIAAVGDSGGRGRNALYFEVRHQGDPVDPATWCAGTPGERVVQAP